MSTARPCRTEAGTRPSDLDIDLATLERLVTSGEVDFESLSPRQLLMFQRRSMILRLFDRLQMSDDQRIANIEAVGGSGVGLGELSYHQQFDLLDSLLERWRLAEEHASGKDDSSERTHELSDFVRSAGDKLSDVEALLFDFLLALDRQCRDGRLDVLDVLQKVAATVEEGELSGFEGLASSVSKFAEALETRAKRRTDYQPIKMVAVQFGVSERTFERFALLNGLKPRYCMGVKMFSLSESQQALTHNPQKPQEAEAKRPVRRKQKV